MSSSPEKIRNVRRLVLFIVPVYLVVAAGFYFSDFHQKTPARPGISEQHIQTPGNGLAQQGIVSRVIDGDTADVLIGEKTERVRFIGIDTPETVDPRKPVQCFGKEASAETSRLLPEGMAVGLAGDPTQDDRDRYGRLLRYVVGPDGADIGLKLVSLGFAHEYTFIVPYQRQAEYQAAQRTARAASLGFWSAATCDGKTQ